MITLTVSYDFPTKCLWQLLYPWLTVLVFISMNRVVLGMLLMLGMFTMLLTVKVNVTYNNFPLILYYSGVWSAHLGMKGENLNITRNMFTMRTSFEV